MKMTQIEKALTRAIISYTGDDSLDDVKSVISTVRDHFYEGNSDQWLDTTVGGFRIISEDEIFEIYLEEQENLIKDCFLGGAELPRWLEIDWEKTAQNVLESDGYGHHFSSYDGGEGFTNGFYIFRVN